MPDKTRPVDSSGSNDSAKEPADSRRVSTTGDIEVATYLEIASLDRATGARATGEPQPALEAIAVIDFGSQYSHLIARRVREAKVFCEIISHNAPREAVEHLDLKGIILSGGPGSVYDDDARLAPAWVFDAGVPVLGICYGMQLISHQLGGKVAPSATKEYGHAVIHRDGDGTSRPEPSGIHVTRLFDCCDLQSCPTLSRTGRHPTRPTPSAVIAGGFGTPINANTSTKWMGNVNTTSATHFMIVRIYRPPSSCRSFNHYGIEAQSFQRRRGCTFRGRELHRRTEHPRLKKKTATPKQWERPPLWPETPGASTRRIPGSARCKHPMDR